MPAITLDTITHSVVRWEGYEGKLLDQDDNGNDDEDDDDDHNDDDEDDCSLGPVKQTDINKQLKLTGSNWV
jgi:hypothetical protein